MRNTYNLNRSTICQKSANFDRCSIFGQLMFQQECASQQQIKALYFANRVPLI